MRGLWGGKEKQLLTVFGREREDGISLSITLNGTLNLQKRSVSLLNFKNHKRQRITPTSLFDTYYNKYDKELKL